MGKKLEGKKVAILVADGFEQVELTEPKKALEDAGAITEIVSPADNEVQVGITTRRQTHLRLICR